MKAPFPWFGGKRRVARLVWDALGQVGNYVEPFAGSLAVLLERPGEMWRTGAETVNDKDGFVANFWRALAYAPEETAKWADWPVNEADLIARHLWLVNEGRASLLERLEGDPEWCDPRVAGWWVWGISSWIGRGWCSGTGPWHVVEEDGCKLPRLGNTGQGVIRQRPHLGNAGVGVNRQRPHLNTGQGVDRQLPHLGNAGKGVNRQRPHLGDTGQGVNRQLPYLSNTGQGVHGDGEFKGGGSGAQKNEWRGEPGIAGYFAALSKRLRRVRVCCGDWSRVVTRGALAHGATVGVFLDPPYLGAVRTKDLYAVDDHSIADEVRDWCVANGDNKRLRIVLAGYEEEHAEEMAAAGWRMHAYSGPGGYGPSRQGENEGSNANRHLERLWFSPHCLSERAPGLFGGVS